MRKTLILFLTVCMLGCLCLAACNRVPQAGFPTEQSSSSTTIEDSSSSTTIEDSSSSTDTPVKPPVEDKYIRVLFLGNSLMFFNDMPSLFRNLAEKAGKELYVDSVTRGSATISDFAHSYTDVGAQAYPKLLGERWDYVIIEPSRRITPYENTTYNAELQAAKVLQNMAKNAGAEILLYCVWGNNDGTLTEYNATNPTSMIKGQVHYDYTRKMHTEFLKSVSTRFSEELGGVGVIDAGYAFENSIAEYPNINLYDSDNRHPSLEGSYLAAACVYATIYKQSPENIGFTGGTTLYFEMQKMARVTVLDKLVPDLTENDTPEEIEQVDDPNLYDVLFVGSDLINNYDIATSLTSMVSLGKGLGLNVKFVTNSTGVFNKLVNENTDFGMRDALARTKFDAIILQISRRCTPSATDVEASELSALKAIYPIVCENSDNVFLFTLNGNANASIFTTQGDPTNYVKTDRKESATIDQMNEYYDNIAKGWANEVGCGYILQGSAWTEAAPATDATKGYLRACCLYNGIFGEDIPENASLGGVEESVATSIKGIVAKHCLPQEEVILPEYDTFDLLVIGSKLLDNYDATTSLASMMQIGQDKELYLHYVTNSVGVLNKLSQKDGSDSFYSSYKTALEERKWDAVVIQLSRRMTPGSAVEASELIALKAILAEISTNCSNVYLITLVGTENPSIYLNEGVDYTKSSYKLSVTLAEVDAYFAQTAQKWAQELNCGVIDQGLAWTQVSPANSPEKGYLRASAYYNALFGVKVPSNANTNGVSEERAKQIAKAVCNVILGKLPADLTALNQAIAVANQKSENDYTPNSWVAFASALANAKTYTAESEQEDVDLALQKLNGAIENLVLRADFTALNQAIELANSKNENDYNLTSWQALQTAVANANGIDANAIQSQVDQATASLNGAIENLVLRANFTALNQAIELAKSKAKANYTDETWNSLESALAVAESLDANATQSQVDQATASLNGAIENLVLKADLTALNQAIAVAESKDSTLYTPASWANLQDALTTAKALNENSSTQAVADATVALNEAIANLVVKADFTALNQAIAVAESKDKNLYTSASWGLLHDALVVAKALDANATQNQVEDALTALNDAIGGLIAKADLTELNKVIASANELNPDDYDESTWQALQNAISASQGLTTESSQAQVDEAVNNIKDAMDALKPAVTLPDPTTFDILFVGSDLINDEYIYPSLSSMISLGQTKELYLHFVTDGVGVINRLVYREEGAADDDIYTRFHSALEERRWDVIIIQLSRRITPGSTVVTSEFNALKTIYPLLTAHTEDIYLFTLNGSANPDVFTAEGVSYAKTGETYTATATEMATFYQTTVEAWGSELGCGTILYGSAFVDMAPSTSKPKGFMRALCMYYSIFGEEMPDGTDVQGTSSTGVKKIKAAAAKYCLA